MTDIAMTGGVIFANFNDHQDDPSALALEDMSEPDTAADDLRTEAWTDGFLTGRQERAEPRNLAAKLLTSVAELDATAVQAVEAASLAVADLLVNTVIAATSETWSAGLMDRVRTAVERIKPALTAAPDFVLRDDQGAMHHFDDISALSHALEAGGGEDVSIVWHRGEATISRTALLEDLRQAIIPLSAGLVNSSNVRLST